MRGRSFVTDLTLLRTQRSFRLIWSGHAASEFGRQAVSVAIPFQVYVMTGDALAIAGLALVQLGPILALSLAGGSMADRFDRRRLLVLAQAGLCATSLALAAATAMGVSELWPYYALAAGIAGVSAIDRPARKATLYGIVPREQIPAAAGIDQLAVQLSAVAGPAIGGVLIGATGLAATYLAAALAYALMGLMVVVAGPLPRPTLPSAARLGGVLEGLRYVWASPVILSAMVLDLIVMTFGYRFALFPILAVDVFRIGPQGLGILTAAPAVGAVVATLVSGLATGVQRRGVALLVATTIWGISIALVGLVTFSLPLCLVLLAVSGGADVLTAVLRTTLVHTMVPDELRGRVASLQIMVVTTGPRLGDLEATTVAALTSVQASIVSGGVICVLGTMLVARAVPRLLTAGFGRQPPPAGAPGASHG